MQWKMVVTLILALLISLFAILNVNPVSVNFLLTQADIPLVLLIFGCAVAGALVGALLGFGDSLGRRRVISELKGQLQQTERERDGFKQQLEKLAASEKKEVTETESQPTETKD